MAIRANTDFPNLTDELVQTVEMWSRTEHTVSVGNRRPRIHAADAVFLPVGVRDGYACGPGPPPGPCDRHRPATRSMRPTTAFRPGGDSRGELSAQAPAPSYRPMLKRAPTQR